MLVQYRASEKRRGLLLSPGGFLLSNKIHAHVTERPRINREISITAAKLQKSTLSQKSPKKMLLTAW